METYTGIQNQSPVYGVAKPGAAPKPYGSAAVNQHFGDVYNQQAQQSYVDMDRANTKAAGEYYGNAQQAQTQSALAGLGLLNTQQQNAWQRQNAQQRMAYGLMNDITSGSGGLLKGLL